MFCTRLEQFSNFRLRSLGKEMQSMLYKFLLILSDFLLKKNKKSSSDLWNLFSRSVKVLRAELLTHHEV